MTEQEYNSEIKYCQDLIDKSESAEALYRLENLYKLKPVRLNWYITKAKYLWKTSKKVKPVFEILSEKSWHLFSYPGIQELSKFYINVVNSYKDYLDAKRHKLLYLMISEEKTKEDILWIEKEKSHFEQAKKNFIKKPESNEAIECLLDYYFCFQNYIMFFLLTSYIQQLKINITIKRKWFQQFTNIGYLKENIEEKTDTPFFVIEDENSDYLDYEIAIYILRSFHKKIYLLKTPIPIEIEHEINIEDTVSISMDSMIINDNMCTLYPMAVINNGELLEDNREYILSYLIQNDLKNQVGVAITSGVMFDNLCCQPVLKKSLERLRGVSSPALESQMTFGWIGSYLSYISQIHIVNAEQLLNRSTSTSYSIIIPARNSAKTLRYTLMSCLNQRYQGSYEIVLSDNSSPGNTEIYQLYKQLGDSRIKYYRTPREYNLSRSFEFAFLHAKGEFLLSLGSDDALLPWCLETLDGIRKKYPDEDIIQWERGFYAWPYFNGGQQNQFVIPKGYKKNQWNQEYLSREYYFSSILSNSNLMYLLPNLYLNSGCKRSYVKKILKTTGRFYDGICQDIYMGMVNVALNEKILNIHYPLSIAGMSGNSIGAKANMVYELKEDEVSFLNDLKKTANIGGYCASPYERLMPQVTTDKSSLYNCILRLIARGVIAESDLEHINFRRWFLDVFSQMDICDPLFDKKIHLFRYTASLHGEDFLKWFDEKIYYNALRPHLIEEDKLAKLKEQKSYIEGTDKYGCRTLDASKYKVENVYDAALLFEKLSGL